jgi:hypothetical protein
MRAQGARALGFCFLALLTAVSIGMLAAGPARAATFVVNSTGGWAERGPRWRVQPGTSRSMVRESPLRARIRKDGGTRISCTKVRARKPYLRPAPKVALRGTIRYAGYRTRNTKRAWEWGTFRID